MSGLPHLECADHPLVVVPIDRGEVERVYLGQPCSDGLYALRLEALP